MRQKCRACRSHTAIALSDGAQAGIVGIFVLVLVFVVAVAGGAYYLGRTTTKPQVTGTNQATPTTPTSDLYREPDGSAATANWKTYTDPYYGFVFSYPDVLRVDVGINIPDQSYREVNIFEKDAKGVIEDMIQLTVYSKDINIPSFYINSLPSPQNAEPYYKARQMYSKLNALEPKATMQDDTGSVLFTRLSNINIQGVILGQYEGRRTLNASQGVYRYQRGALLDKGDVLYVFYVRTQAADTNRVPVRYFDQILSTFRFD